MNQFIFNPSIKNNEKEFSRALNLTLNGELPVIICVGTDLVVGDCLGPYIGTKLNEKLQGKSFIYGTLNSPITALEIETIKKTIKIIHPSSKILVIDAAVGKKDEIGFIKLIDSGIKPGLGINKDLPSIGDVSIIGIVSDYNNKTASNQPITRFSLVYRIANQIINGITNYILKK